ncbi:MAG: spore cortex-lytic enzyme [Firmicutes bacterium]|nr:spore cortex-lytic enzyme [Bacillota bacterium]
MLFLEERYVKIIGSVLALGLAAAVLFTAVSAAALSKDAVKTAQSIDIDEESSEEEAPGSVTVKHDIDITPSLSEKASSSESDRKPVEQVKGQKGPAQQSPAASTQKTGSGLSEGDIWLMAQLIYAEGRGESLEGQVAIGAVLLNRLRDSRFPNTVAGVIYEPGAFCTVRDGQINLTPDAKALKAARLAAAGWDPTGGALYFYNPARSTSAWIYTRPVLTRIGHHVFAG